MVSGEMLIAARDHALFVGAPFCVPVIAGGIYGTWFYRSFLAPLPILGALVKTSHLPG